MKHILICKIQSITYSSTEYFADVLAAQFMAAGCKVEVFDAKKESMMNIERYSGRKFDAIFDFNSVMPRIQTDDEGYFLDTINAPFYNVILDHPLFHHEILSVPLKNYNVICIDDEHREYLRKYYHNINKIYVMPMPGVINSRDIYKPSDLNMGQRPYDIIFTGTYTDPNVIYELIESMDQSLVTEMKRQIEFMIANPETTHQQALAMMLKEDGRELSERIIPLYLHGTFLVDTYVNAYFRKKVCESILKAGTKIDTFGQNWELLSRSYPGMINAHGNIRFDQTAVVASRAKISVNVMPWFKYGMHDRIYTAMLNGAVCLTDSSKYIKENFTDGRDILLYSLSRTDEIPEILAGNLENVHKLEEISKRAFSKTVDGFDIKKLL